MRPELAPLPDRMKRLPFDARGYPVPWFVAWVPGPDGVDVPEFRAADGRKLVRAVKDRLCWVCGQPLGRYLAFTIGPMCAVNRISSEPPSHRECAEWSIRNCPFLSRPQMTRRDNDLPDDVSKPGGTMIERNPGVTLLWVTTSYKTLTTPDGKLLIHVGQPLHTEWWTQGRPATRAECEASIASGLPALEQIADAQDATTAWGTSRIALSQQVTLASALLPAEDR